MGQKKCFTGPSQIAKTDDILSASDLLSKNRNLVPIWVRCGCRVHSKITFASPSHLAVIDSIFDDHLKYTPPWADVYDTSRPLLDLAGRASGLFI